MRSTLLISLFCLALTNLISGQSAPIICGNDLFSQMVREQYPDLHDAFNTTFDEALHATPGRGSDPLTVNVVVHIVWKEEAENLDESIILDQLRILNEDYNMLNPDISELRSYFQQEAGSAGIQLELAEIIRVQTAVEFDVDLLGGNLLPEVKTTSLGGSDAWNPEHYLNIWVCHIQPIEILGIPLGQILGFAFPPNNLPNWPENSGAPAPHEDGVVIDYRVFGSNNPNTIEVPGGGGNLVIKGRTASHELGHYFGLRHIWGDGGILGPNDCAQSDGIDDTPFANAQSAFDCDKSKNTCLQTDAHYGEDAPDLIENYMDYASEDCMNMFTNGQVALMRNVLEGPRSGLLMPFSSVSNATTIQSLRLSPNPTDGDFILELETRESGQFSISVLNANGGVLHQRAQAAFPSGHHKISFDGLSLAPGLYFVTLQYDRGVTTKKLVVY